MKPQQSITKVARRSLRERLQTVWDRAPLAVKKWKEDVEHVHQLRVATRRASAALRLFDDLLSEREARWLKRRLRQLRRAAGKARDLDVLAERFQRIADGAQGSHLGPLVKQLRKHRRKAQKPLAKTYRKLKRKGFSKRAKALLKSMRWQSDEQEPTFAEAARTRLAPLVDQFFAAAAADLSTVAGLHGMRIAGKRLRYAMELLAGAFEASFRRELYKTFAEVQEKLGIINDHATAITLFTEWLQQADDNGGREVLGKLIADEHESFEAKCQSFRDWWTGERAAQLATRFAQVLQEQPTSVARRSAVVNGG